MNIERTDRKRKREKEGDKDRQTERQINKQTCKLKESEIDKTFNIKRQNYNNI